MYGGRAAAGEGFSTKCLPGLSEDFDVDLSCFDLLTRNSSDLSYCSSSALGAVDVLSNKPMISCHFPIRASIMSLGVGKRAGRCTAAMSGIEVVVKGEYSRAPTKLPLSKEAATSIATL